METSKAILLGAAVISLSILYVGGAIPKLGIQGYQPQAGAPTASTPPGAVTPPVVANLTTGSFPVKGDAKAPVTVVEFADFQCPFCEAVSGLQPNSQLSVQLKGQDKSWAPYELGIENDYVKTGKVKFAYRDFSFLGQESNDAANAARCANEQGKFWDYHDKLFSSQSGENQGTFAKDKLKKFALDLGLDATKFNNCVDTDKFAKDVQADTEAGRTAGVSGTPAVFINGKMISGAVGYATVKAAIDLALSGK